MIDTVRHNFAGNNAGERWCPLDLYSGDVVQQYDPIFVGEPPADLRAFAKWGLSHIRRPGRPTGERGNGTLPLPQRVDHLRIDEIVLLPAGPEGTTGTPSAENGDGATSLHCVPWT